jgi:hypothetical protein
MKKIRDERSAGKKMSKSGMKDQQERKRENEG